jgi:hydrophobic/amphiphilic exporter-1 (mainly G- bacteria), HAE1 family
MKFSHFFIDRPIFAMALSILVLLAGGVAYLTLPVAQYPEIVPPTVQIQATYPGADPQVLADTVAAPIEEQVNGVENMLYMSSQMTSNGNVTITVTFGLGTDIDKAQVLVQNRVSIAQARLPQEVRRSGLVP